jgi:hypothetical protein
LKNAGFAIDHRSWRTKATLGYSSTIAVVTTTKRLSPGKNEARGEGRRFLTVGGNQ